MSQSTKSIQSRMDNKNILKLEALAQLKGLSFSSMIRYILLEYIENNLHKLNANVPTENK